MQICDGPFRMMADRSDDYGASDDDDDDGTSQETMPFEVVLHEIHPFLALMRMWCYCGAFINIVIVDPH
jgi:hypothetical protein